MDQITVTQKIGRSLLLPGVRLLLGASDLSNEHVCRCPSIVEQSLARLIAESFAHSRMAIQGGHTNLMDANRQRLPPPSVDHSPCLVEQRLDKPRL